MYQNIQEEDQTIVSYVDQPNPVLEVLAVSIGILTMTTPVMAISAGVGTLTTVIGWLQGIGVAVCTIAVMWAGFKIMFQGARINDVAPAFIGGIIVGSAALIAALIMGS
jgi:type IV secretion system protein VirB2